MKLNGRNVCAYSGPAAMILLFGGMLLAGFVPPPSPNNSAEQTASLYRDNLLAVRAGVSVAAFGSVLLVPWYGVLATHIRSLEGAQRRLTYTWLVAAGGGMMDFVLPLLTLQAAAYRPEDALFVQHLNDLAWIWFIAGAPIFSVQAAVLGVAILQPRTARAALPRWSGYLSLWCAVLFVCGILCVFFKTGPLTWNGIIGFWPAAVSYGIWIITFAVLLVRRTESDGEGTGSVVEASSLSETRS